jgi:hypothetical protein
VGKAKDTEAVTREGALVAQIDVKDNVVTDKGRADANLIHLQGNQILPGGVEGEKDQRDQQVENEVDEVI